MEEDRKTITDEEALNFHRKPTPGKIAVVPTKPMATQRDLSLAYSPGVAVPVRGALLLLRRRKGAGFKVVGCPVDSLRLGLRWGAGRAKLPR